MRSNWKPILAAAGAFAFVWLERSEVMASLVGNTLSVVKVWNEDGGEKTRHAEEATRRLGNAVNADLKALTAALSSISPTMAEINARRISGGDAAGLLALRREAVLDQLRWDRGASIEVNAVFGALDAELECRGKGCDPAAFDKGVELPFCRLHQVFRPWIDEQRRANPSMYQRVVAYGDGRSCEAVVTAALKSAAPVRMGDPTVGVVPIAPDQPRAPEGARKG